MSRQLKLGEYELEQMHINRLGLTRSNQIYWNESDKNILQRASSNLVSAGYSKLQTKGPYLVSDYCKNKEINDVNAGEDSQHVGQIRVSFMYDSCGPATVIAR